MLDQRSGHLEGSSSWSRTLVATQNAGSKQSYARCSPSDHDHSCCPFLLVPRNSITQDPLSTRLSRGTEVVVKFASKYNVAAHRLLADNDLAPKLLYDGTNEHHYRGLIMPNFRRILAFITWRPL